MHSGRLYRNTSHVAPPGGSEWASGEEVTVPEPGQADPAGEGKAGRERTDRGKQLTECRELRGPEEPSASPRGAEFNKPL